MKDQKTTTAPTKLKKTKTTMKMMNFKETFPTSNRKMKVMIKMKLSQTIKKTFWNLNLIMSSRILIWIWNGTFGGIL